MYIAFKWLVFLALLQWCAMCFIDTFIKEKRKIRSTDDIEVILSFDNYMNESLIIDILPLPTEVKSTEALYYNGNSKPTVLQFLTFMAGALAVAAYRKKKDLVIFAHRKMPTIKMIFDEVFHNSKTIALKIGTTLIHYSFCIREILNIVFFKICYKIHNMKKTPISRNDKVHAILLKKLNELAEERKSLGQLLISALRENKNIRMQYELETMTKNRLMQHIEDTQRQVKENRTKYMSFHQSYLLTRQENIYLKARLVKLKQEKEQTDRDLMGLINEVYLSKNKDLKTYCTRFLVKTKDNLLNSDVGAEIKKFLENSRKSSKISVTSKSQVINTNKIPSSTSLRINEIVNEEDCLVPLASDAPKLRGLPGEYVWTVKDKDGIIEKIYEYDYESDLNSGDTIRRIRQYSVYFDKDCLIDFSRQEDRTESASSISQVNSKMCQSLSGQKIVTGSDAFQNFLKNSTSIVQIKTNAAPLLY